MGLEMTQSTFILESKPKRQSKWVWEVQPGISGDPLRCTSWGNGRHSLFKAPNIEQNVCFSGEF